MSNALSEREKEVLGHMITGLTNSEVAGKMFLSRRTIETHRKNLLIKTGTRNTAELVAKCFRTGIIQ